MQDYKIFSLLTDITETYSEPVQILEGLTFDMKDTLRTIEFYSNDKFMSGNRDQLGREKPFYNICNFRVTVAKTATDIDVKDIKFEPESLKDSVATMLINHELFKYLKDSGFSETLNDMGKTRPKYGGLLVKKYEDDGELEIQVVDWRNVEVDPCSIAKGIIVETHYMWPHEVQEKADVWDNVSEFLKAHAKANKNKPKRLEIKEVSGEFPYSYDPELDDSVAKESKFKKMCFYIGVVNKKKYFLYKEDMKDDEDKYKYLAWEKIPGRDFGRGIVEEGFEAQVWTNDAMIATKNAMELFGKVILSTDSNKISGNAITGVDNGHIFQIEQGRSLTSVNLGATSLPEYQNIIQLWRQQYDNSASVHDANTGEAPTAGTPYSQTALLNQVANSPFEYQREVWGIFLNEILNDWILPYLKKKIKKAHYLVSEFGEEDLKIIDEAIGTRETNKMIKESLLKGVVPTPEDVNMMGQSVQKELSKFGTKREIQIPEGFLDVEGKITANITGELKNKQAVLASLAQIAKDITASFNPNTGEYMALKDPTLAKIYGTIIEMSGVPLSFAQLKTGVNQAVSQGDPSAVQPVNPLPTNV